MRTRSCTRELVTVPVEKGRGGCGLRPFLFQLVQVGNQFFLHFSPSCWCAFVKPKTLFLTCGAFVIMRLNVSDHLKVQPFCFRMSSSLRSPPLSSGCTGSRKGGKRVGQSCFRKAGREMEGMEREKQQRACLAGGNHAHRPRSRNSSVEAEPSPVG